MSQKSKTNAIESEELYQVLFEQAADGIFIADGQGRYIRVNQRGCEMLGYTSDEIRHLSMQDLIPDEDLPNDPLQLDVLRTGNPLLKERRLRCKNGRLLSVEISARMLTDGNMLGIVRDISERKQAEEKLRESNERFRLLSESSLTGIYLIQENIFRYVNPAMAQIFGYEVEEIIDKLGPSDLVYPEDRSLVAENVRRRVEGEKESIHYEFRGLRKDGLVIHIDVHGRRIEYGGKLGVIGTLVEVTERKQAEQALRASEDRLQLALGAAHMGQWEWNLVTGEMAWSPQCLALYGLPTDTQISYDQFLQAIHPEDREHIDSALHKAVKECTGYDELKRTIWPDGSVHWMASRGQVYCDNSGNPIRMIGVTFDVSEWKKAEDELRHNREAAIQFSEQLRAVQEIANKLSKVQTSDDLCQQAVLLARAHLGFDRVGIWFIDDAIEMMHGTFGTDERGELRDERKAQVKLRHEGLAWRIYSRKEPVALVEHCSLRNHLGQEVGEGDNAMAALWDGDNVIGIISVDNLFTGRPIRGSQLETLQLYATTLGHLITRKRAEEARRASEERFRALYLDNPSMFFTLDSDGVIISVNAFGASQLGYTIAELEGQSVLNVFYEEDQTAVINQLQHCMQNSGQIDSWQVRKIRKDGSLLWVEEFARTVTDPNGAVNILIVCQDITDRKQAEIEREHLLFQIQEQAYQVQNIIDTVPEGVILLSKGQFVTLTNPVAAQFLTVLAPDLENGRLTHLGERPLYELLTSPPKGLWHEIVSEDLIFEAIARPVENSPENGGWVLVLRDITQEREIQRRAQRQERLAAVGQLAAGIAHDFNNILAVVGLYAELVSRTTELPARTQKQLHTIEQQVKRATDLIQQILDFSRQSILDRQPLDLSPFMEKLVVLLERTLPEHIRIELDYTADTYFIQADPTRMQQVMMNLAVNARDAMPEGGYLKFGLAYVYTKEAKPMSFQELPSGNWIQLEVTDTGSGIDPESLSNIFEPFFTTKKEGRGTGLGLAQVYGIIQQHDGYIDVVTEIGKGTTFFLYFPVLDTGKNESGTPDRSELQLGQGQRILLVEDNPATREALLDSLTLLNYQVMVATNGQEALTILTTRADDIDLVMSDVVMPEMGGIALFHAIRKQNLTTPVVLLTGHPLSKEMDNLQSLGLAGWLHKPPDLVNISSLLAETLT